MKVAFARKKGSFHVRLYVADNPDTLVEKNPDSDFFYRGDDIHEASAFLADKFPHHVWTQRVSLSKEQRDWLNTYATGLFTENFLGKGVRFANETDAVLFKVVFG